MKVRFSLANNYGYGKETSVDMDVDIVPRIGELIYIDNTELLNALDSVGVEPICSKGMSRYEEDYLSVVEVFHDYTPTDFGVYIILAADKKDYA